MGELKQLSEQQQSLVERVKNVGQQIYLANLGLVAKVETESKKQYDRIVAAGVESRGEQVMASSKAALVATGLVEVLKSKAEQLKGDGFKQADAIKQRLTGINLKEKTQKLFDELIAEGEKRKAV